ncbi:MAG: flagellar biosynthesis regulator FlaF [Deltaproteobacteria bacterium]|nr:flagellar biosynthesis regulator FlaF [Deltaproteobacteria bacterium]
MPALGLKAYQEALKTTTSGRNLEAAVLTKAARLLILCQEQWNEEGHFRRWDEALTFNQKVWTIFQDELAKEDHPMPIELRANILKLSLMVDKRIIEVMGNDSSPDRLDLIININNNIAAGLRGSGALSPVRK